MAGIKVRQADMEDLTEILRMGREMHQTCSFRHLRFDPREFGEFAIDLIASPGHAIFLVEDEHGAQGGILASTSKSFMGPDLVAAEHAFFVRPECRSYKAARKLVNAYIEWAVQQGAKRINMGNSAGMPDDGYVRFLERAGFTRSGSLLYMNV